MTSLRNLWMDLRKREYIKHASSRRVIRQISHRTYKAERCSRVTRIESTRNDRSGPPPTARKNRNVLLAIRTAISNRLADNSRAALELPQQHSTLRIQRLEPAV